MKNEIYTAIGEILCGLHLTTGDQAIRPETGIAGIRLLGRGGIMDSLTAMRFISAVEKRFNVDIMDDMNLDCMETTDSLADYILKNKPPGPVSIGKHLVIDCASCPVQKLNSHEAVRDLIHAVAGCIGVQVLKEGYHSFSPAGITGFAIVSASHIAVHTWPEYGYMGLDIFSCRHISPEKVVALINEIWGPVTCRYQLLDRNT